MTLTNNDRVRHFVQSSNAPTAQTGLGARNPPYRGCVHKPKPPRHNEESRIFNYESALNRIPAPGTGCHASLLGVANLGAIAGLSQGDVFQDIRRSIPQGRRRVPDAEIHEAIRKAYDEHVPDAGYRQRMPQSKPSAPPFDGQAYRQKLIDRSEGCTEADFLEASPMRIDWGPGPRDALAVLQTFYLDEDVLFLGDVYDRDVATVAQHVQHLGAGHTMPHIIPNPLTGDRHPTGTGKDSYRCDAAVTMYRFAVVEFDDIPRCDQVQLWHTVIRDGLLPVAVLIDSGGKSIHAWLRVELPDAASWQREIRDGLYHPVTGIMTAIGADRACQNPSRLSRLPGHFREGKNCHQRLLYLDRRACHE